MKRFLSLFLISVMLLCLVSCVKSGEPIPPVDSSSTEPSDSSSTEPVDSSSEEPVDPSSDDPADIPSDGSSEAGPSSVLCDDQRVVKLGRGFYSEDMYVFGNTASGFCVSFTGTSLSADLRSEYKRVAEIFKQPSEFYVVVDGDHDNATLFEVKNRETVCLTSGLSYGKHTVALYKSTEAMNSTMALYGLTCDGYFESAPEMPDLKIEVYGDSISVGLESVKKKGEPDAVAGNDGYHAYGPQAAFLCDAQISVHARSSLCLCGLCGINIFDYLDSPCCNGDIFIGERDADWNVGDYDADIVVINLGTNDTAYPAYTTQFEGECHRFLSLLREAYGEDTVFILCEGAMLNNMNQLVHNVVDAEDNAYYLYLPLSANGHPCVEEQAVYAERLADLIKTIVADQ